MDTKTPTEVSNSSTKDGVSNRGLGFDSDFNEILPTLECFAQVKTEPEDDPIPSSNEPDSEPADIRESTDNNKADDGRVTPDKKGKPKKWKTRYKKFQTKRELMLKNNLKKGKLIIEKLYTGENKTMCPIIYKGIVIIKPPGKLGYKVDDSELLKFKKDVNGKMYYFCEDCDFICEYPPLFQVHFLTHANVHFLRQCFSKRQFKCSSCSFETFCKAELKTHMLKHWSRPKRSYVRRSSKPKRSYLKSSKSKESDVADVSSDDDDLDESEQEDIKEEFSASASNSPKAIKECRVELEALNDELLSNIKMEYSDDDAQDVKYDDDAETVKYNDDAETVKYGDNAEDVKFDDDDSGDARYDDDDTEDVKYDDDADAEHVKHDNDAENVKCDSDVEHDANVSNKTKDVKVSEVEVKVLNTIKIEYNEDDEVAENVKYDDPAEDVKPDSGVDGTLVLGEIKFEVHDDDTLSTKPQKKKSKTSKAAAAREGKRKYKEHTCRRCDFVTTYPNRMKNHKCERSRVVCNMCGMEFKSIGVLNLHLENHIKSEMTFRDNKFHCDVCGETALQHISMKYHVHFKHCTPGNTICGLKNCSTLKRAEWRCEQCPKGFCTRMGLVNHVDKHHSVGNSYGCSICQLCFKSKYAMQRHKALHPCWKCPFESTVLEEVFAHRKTHPMDKEMEKVVSCDKCIYQTRSKNRLKNHEVIHVEKSFHVCSQCGFKTKSRGNLNVHERSHLKLEEYSCTLCEYKTRNFRLYMNHKVTHGLDKNAIMEPAMPRDPGLLYCDKCEFRTKYPQYFRGHQLTHDKIRPYLCSECGSSFTSSVALNIHKKKHSTNGENRKFCCSFCEYSSPIKQLVIIHERRHTGVKPYKCEECPYASSYLANFNSHKKIHLKAK